MWKLIKKAARFIKEVIDVASAKVTAFVKGVIRHAETVTILVLAVFGLANLIGELPFYISLPMWVEAAWVAPVVAVILIKLLLKFNEWRLARHLPYNAV